MSIPNQQSYAQGKIGHNKMKRDNKEYRTFKVTMELDKYEIIMTAIKEIQQQYPNISDARALELIAGDYLAGK